MEGNEAVDNVNEESSFGGTNRRNVGRRLTKRIVERSKGSTHVETHRLLGFVNMLQHVSWNLEIGASIAAYFNVYRNLKTFRETFPNFFERLTDLFHL